jgi:hypothetical protein
VPAGAAFCPACGASTTGVVLEPAMPAEDVGDEVALGGHRHRRGGLIAILVAIALVGAAFLLGRGGDGGAGGAQPTTVASAVTTVVPAMAPVTTAVSTTTTDYGSAGGTGPVLAPGTTGMLWTLVRNGVSNLVVRVDLATGDVQRRRIDFAVSDQTGLVASPVGALVVTDSSTWSIDTELDVAQGNGLPKLIGLSVSPNGDEAWGQTSDISSPQLWRLSFHDGVPPQSFAVPDQATFVGLDPSGEPLVASIGGTFVLDPPTGSWHRVSDAYARVAQNGAVVEHTCDDALNCVTQVRDLATGEHHALQAVDATPGYYFALAVASAHGAVAAVVDDGPNGVRLVVWGPDGQIIQQVANVNAVGPSPLSFTPDGAYLLYSGGSTLHVLPLDGPVDSAASAEVTLRDLLGGSVAAAAVAPAG